MRRETTETEAKFLVRDLAEIERRLRGMRTKLIQARTHEWNLRMDTADQRLTRSGRVLRLRQDSTVHLTYKDSGQVRGGTLSRREIEIEVNDWESAQALLLALGFSVVFAYEKYRTTYAVESTEVMLDELPMGDFVEIEGDVSPIQSVAEGLGLSWRFAIPHSYHELFRRLQVARDLPFRDLTFSNLTGMSLLDADLGLLPADGAG